MGGAERDFHDPTLTSGPPFSDESRLVEALRHGDEVAFVTLIERYHPALVRLAAAWVPSRAAVEAAVRETWLDVLQGVLQFDGRSPLKTWIFRLLVNRLKTRGDYIPFPTESDAATGAPAVQADRFLPPNHAKWPGHWAVLPKSWSDVPESRLLARDTRGRIEAAITRLPPYQHAVIRLRDMEGWTAPEVAHVLGIGAAQQRALLHQARSTLRRVLEAYLYEE
jgi:RNA polymerase sigma-70 factor (ECF subfamily)